MTLWHYTCLHSHAQLGDEGLLLPPRQLTRFDGVHPDYWPADLIWLTDLATPIRDALGLTSTMIACDRTRHRYRVTDEHNVRKWTKVRRSFPDARYLELAEGARPAHWYVSRVPVPVVYDPR